MRLLQKQYKYTDIDGNSRNIAFAQEENFAIGVWVSVAILLDHEASRVLDDTLRRIVCIGAMMDPGLKTIKDTAPESMIDANAG